MSKPQYVCRESALMIAAPLAVASAIAIADFPAAVGPQTTRRVVPHESAGGRRVSGSLSLLPSKPALELVPRELHDRGSPVHVVRGQRRPRELDEQRAHLR